MPEKLNRRVLVVDDNPAIHEDFRKILTVNHTTTTLSLDQQTQQLFGEASAAREESYDIDYAFQGQEGFEKIRAAQANGNPYMVAFIDVRMPPGWDGVETIQKVSEVDRDLQLVLCTAYSDYSVDEIVDRFGTTDRLLMLKKPFDVAEVNLLALALSEKWTMKKKTNEIIHAKSEEMAGVERVMMVVKQSFDELKSEHNELRTRARQLSNQLQEQAVAILGTRQVAVFALAQLAESRDPETGEHLLRMREFSQILAEYLQEHGPYTGQIDHEFLENFFQSSPLHDIGKVGIPDSILLKPGPLTTSEFEIMKRHTLIGALALERAAHHCAYGDFLRMAADVARCHHEHYDGNGYPCGLKGESIPLSARIVSIADVFDALSSTRVYKDAMPPEEARAIIKEGSGTQFDPFIVSAFLDCYDEIVETRHAINETGALPNVSDVAAESQSKLLLRAD